MRNLNKLHPPPILADNWFTWTRENRNDPTNETKKFRYRHATIKAKLLEETSNKCVYCESKVGDTLPGDIDHIVPASIRQVGRFFWRNMTIACVECNRRKHTYYDKAVMFLNPYVDDVESMVLHQGPLVTWQPGNVRAEVTVKKLELHNANRWQLISQKIEHLEHLNDNVHRMKAANGVQSELAKIKIQDMCRRTQKYSAMVKSAVKNLLPDS